MLACVTSDGGGEPPQGWQPGGNPPQGWQPGAAPQPQPSYPPQFYFQQRAGMPTPGPARSGGSVVAALLAVAFVVATVIVAYVAHHPAESSTSRAVGVGSGSAARGGSVHPVAPLTDTAPRTSAIPSFTPVPPTTTVPTEPLLEPAAINRTFEVYLNALVDHDLAALHSATCPRLRSTEIGFALHHKYVGRWQGQPYEIPPGASYVTVSAVVYLRDPGTGAAAGSDTYFWYVERASSWRLLRVRIPVMSQPYLPAQGYGYPPPGRGGLASRTANPLGIALATIGGGLALIGTLVDWYSPGSTSWQDIIQALDAPGAKAFPKAYFGWLMWVLLALTVVAALFANTAGPLGTTLRVVSPLFGVLGAVLVCTSLGQLIQRGSIFDHSSAGLWLVLAGFILAGAGGIPGPRRSAGATPPQAHSW